MPHFFERRDHWGQGLGIWVLVGLAFVLPFALWGISRLTMENDIQHWLSSETPSAQKFEWYKQHFPVEDNILVTWPGSHLDDPRMETFAQKLLGETDAKGIRHGGVPQVQAVRTPGQILSRMMELKVPKEEGLKRLQGVLLGPGKIWGQLSAVGLENKDKHIAWLQEQALQDLNLEIKITGPIVDWETLEDTLEETAEEAPEPIAEADSTEATEVAAEETAASTGYVPEPIPSHDLQIMWPAMHTTPGAIEQFIIWAKTLRIPVAGSREGEPLFEDCFLHSGQPAAVAILLSEAGHADRAGSVREISNVAKTIGIDPEGLRWAGSPIATLELNEAVKAAVWNPAAPWYQPHRRSVVISSWLIGVVLAFWLLRDVRLTIIVLAVSYFTTLATVALLPAMGTSFNMVLVVMPTLLLLVTMSGAVHLLHYWKNEMHRDPSQAVVRAILTARKPCLLAAVTTAMGLASLMTSELAPVWNFGLYSAIGTMLSVVVVLYAVPALLQVWPGEAPKETEVSRGPWTALGCWVTRYSLPIQVGWGILTIVCMLGLSRFRTETKVIRYFSDDSSVVQNYRFMEHEIAGVMPIETVITFSKAAREELNFCHRMEIVRQVERNIRGVAGITGTVSLADFQPEQIVPAESASMKEKLAFNTRAQASEKRVRKDAQAKSLVSMTKADSLVAPAETECWRITCQASILADQDFDELTHLINDACQKVTRYHVGAQHLITGMVPLFQDTQRAILRSLLDSMLMSVGLIAIMMVALVWNVPAGLLAMIPNLAPVGIVFGAISWARIPVDVGTLITASVALGIAVDGTLHIITWYREALKSGRTPSVAVIRCVEHCGPAIWQTGIVIALAMVILFPADLILISRFGLLMSLLIVTAMLSDMILTPAMLSGWMGHFIAQSVKQEHINRLVDEFDPPPPPAPHVLSVSPKIIENEDGELITRRIDEAPPRRRRRR